MTITFPIKVCAVACTGKVYLLLKRQFKNKARMKGVCYDIAPILGSFAGYRAKRSHNVMLDSHLA